MRDWAGPLLAILLIGALEALYLFGLPAITPGVLLLLPILAAAALASSRVTLITAVLPAAYLLRHYYLNRGEYVSPAAGLSFDDVSRVLLFVAAAAGIVAMARFRETQRAAEQTLHNAYRGATEANAARTQLLAVVSHELRTPLTTIIQYTDLLNAGIGGPLSAEQREMVRRIETGALHLRTLIQELLDYAQLGAGRMAIRPEPVELVPLVSQAVSLLEPAAAAKGIELRVEAPPVAGLCLTDPVKVRQVVINLVENAVKFTDTGSVVVRLDEDRESWVLRVSDTGIGIAAGSLGRVFEPFWQDEEVLVRRRGGLGLGLPITRDLAYALGGEIVIDSRPGEGTEVTVRLPKAAAAAPPVAGSPPSSDREAARKPAPGAWPVD